MVLTTDVLTGAMYITFACIAMFFVFNMLKQVIAVVLMGFASSYLSWITAGLCTGTSVVANGVLIGDEALVQFYNVLAFVMFLLTLAVIGYPVLANKKSPEHQL